MIKESAETVRTLVFDEDGNSHMKNIPGGNLMIAESEDYLKPFNATSKELEEPSKLTEAIVFALV